MIQNRPNQTGLIDIKSRKDSDNLAYWLVVMGYYTSYNAGLGATERRAVEASWLGGKIPFVVCTCAFGIGINKSDCCWIIHFHAPHLLSEYVQEI